MKSNKKWLNEKSIESMKELFMEELFNEKLNKEEIKEKLTKELFDENGLLEMVKVLYNDRPYEVINALYPNIKPWELPQLLQSYWNKETVIEAMSWLFNEKLKWDKFMVENYTTKKVFTNNNLQGLLNHIYKGDVTKAVKDILPYIKEVNDCTPPYDYKKVPQSFWNKETSIEAMSWLFNEKLKWNKEEIKVKTVKQLFQENGLLGMLNTLYNGNIYEAINALYPDIKPWELPRVPQDFWNKENSIEAISWLFNEKLQWDKEEIKEKVTKQTFKENGLLGMLKLVYNCSPYHAIIELYPDIKPWELQQSPRNFWNKETAIEAMSWLFNEKLKWDKFAVENYTTKKVFTNNNLGYMFYNIYGENKTKAINDVLPYIIR